MKIHIVAFSGKAGITQYAYQLCKEISKLEGNNVTLITSSYYELDKFEHNFTVKKIFRKSRHYFLDIWKFLFYIYREKPDVLNFQSTIKFPAFEIFLIKFLKKRITNIVFTVHEPMPQMHKRFFYHKKLYEVFYKQIPKLIVFSKFAKSVLTQTLKNSNSINIIPLGEYSFFETSCNVSTIEARQHLGLDLQKKIVLFFGTIRPDKGLYYLIESFGTVAKKYVDATLAIVGYPAEPFQKYHSLIEELNIKHRVFLNLKYIQAEEVSYYISAADFMVLPYIESTTSGIIQIAFGFLKPVIVANVGNLSEIVEDGETGFLVPPRDADKLAERILLLLNDDILLNKMSHKVREIKSRFSWHKIAADTMEFYRR